MYISKTQFQNELDKWLGTKFLHACRVCQRGCDCIGLIVALYEQFEVIKNVKLPYYNLDFTDWREESPISDMLKSLAEIEKVTEGFQVGDIMLYQFGRCKEGHVALMTNRKSIIHSVVDIGIIESRLDENFYAKRLSYAYRVKNIDWRD